MVDWFAEDFGTHVHVDPHGSWVSDGTHDDNGEDY